MGIEGRIADLAWPGAAAAGLAVDSVQVSQAGSRLRVVVTVDLPETEIGSAGVDAVADASRAIAAALDESDVPDVAYVLEVSTPGTDRRLTERRHFLRARTRTVTLRGADGPLATGRLAVVDDDGVELEPGGRFPWSDIVDGGVELEFKRADEEGR